MERLNGRPDGFRTLFDAEIDPIGRRIRTVGRDAAGLHILKTSAEIHSGNAYSMAEEYDRLETAEVLQLLQQARREGLLTQAEYGRLQGM